MKSIGVLFGNPNPRNLDGKLAKENKISESVSGIIDALSNDDYSVKLDVIDKLREIGQIPEDVVPLLIKALKDESGKVRWRAAEAIGDVFPKSEKIISSLIRCLGDKQYWVRWHAYDVLTRTCDEEQLVSSLIKELSVNEDNDVRSCIIEKLRNFNLYGHNLSTLLIKILLEDKNPDVRAQCALTLANIDRPEVMLALTKALRDENVNVRRNTTLSLGKIKSLSPEIVSSLKKMLKDKDGMVRKYATIALGRSGFYTPFAVKTLVNSFEDRSVSLESWEVLIDIIRNNKIEYLFNQISPEIIFSMISEDSSKGILPTVGVKVWQHDIPIKFPSTIKPYPWEDKGVYHNWLCHGTNLPEQNTNRTMQVCFHSDWFKNIHLIALAHFILFPPKNWDGKIAPVLIEGKEVGPIVQSGGHVVELYKMRKLQKPYKTNRIDFLFCKDFRMMQYLMFAGISANVNFQSKDLKEIKGAKAWKEFTEKFEKILIKYNLQELAKLQWFTNNGLRSSRYRIRYEIPYPKIRPTLTNLFNVIKSKNYYKLKCEVYELVNKIVDQLERLILLERLKEYPNKLLKIIFNKPYDMEVICNFYYDHIKKINMGGIKK